MSAGFFFLIKDPQTSPIGSRPTPSGRGFFFVVFMDHPHDSKCFHTVLNLQENQKLVAHDRTQPLQYDLYHRTQPLQYDLYHRTQPLQYDLYHRTQPLQCTILLNLHHRSQPSQYTALNPGHSS